MWEDQQKTYTEILNIYVDGTSELEKEGTYKNGKKEANWKYYDSDREYMYEKVFKNGKFLEYY